MHARTDQLAPARASSVRWLASELVGFAAALLLATSVVIYLHHAISLASTAPLWMDEVLAVWTARQPSLPAVWQALERGSEFSPPAFDVVLHALIAAGFTSPLAMRLPSIMAGVVAAAAVLVLVRRHASFAIAALAAATVLGGGLFAYAVQARPYACVVAATAWAVVLWDDDSRDARAVGRRAAGILLLCGLAIALHFYAVLLVGLILLGEFARTAALREVRWPVLVALFVAIASILLWWPIAESAATANAQDVVAPDFYARPKLASLLEAYEKFVRPLLPFLLVAGVTKLFCWWSSRRRAHPTMQPTARLIWIALFTCSVPVVVFLFAVAVTHAFNERYVVAGALGVPLILAVLGRSLGGTLAEATALLLLGLTLFLVPAGGEIARTSRSTALAIARSAPPGLSLVTGDGLRFFEIKEDERLRREAHLIYLRVPAPSFGGDSTNRHQVERWATLDPSLPTVGGASFLCHVPVFLLFRDAHGGRDDAPSWLRTHADVIPLGSGAVGLALVRAPPCMARAVKADRRASP